MLEITHFPMLIGAILLYSNFFLKETSGALNFQYKRLDMGQISLIHCVVDIIEQYAEFRHVILVEEYEPEYFPDIASTKFSDVPTGPSSDYLFSHTDFLMRLTHPVLIMEEQFLDDLEGFFVIFTYRLDEAFTEIFSPIRMSKNNRFLIVFLGVHKTNVWALFEVFLKFLKLHVINITVLVDREETVHVYFCHPFGKNVTLANIWNKETMRFKTDVDLYDTSSKMKDMNGFEVKCLTKNKPPDSVVYRRDSGWVTDGLGVNLLLLVSKVMNFTPDIIFPQPDKPQNVDRFGYDISPNMNTLIIGALTIREVDLAFGIYSHLIYDSPTTEFSTATAEECFTFAVPAHAGRPPSIWNDFINEFKPMVWLFLGVTIILNVVLWYLTTLWQYCKDTGAILTDAYVSDELAFGSNVSGLIDDSIKSPYENPLDYFKVQLKHWAFKIRTRVARKSDRMAPVLQEENLTFKNNYRGKLEQLLSNAKNMLSIRPSTEIILSGISPGCSPMNLVDVIFFEIALTLGQPSLNKVGSAWVKRFLAMQYVFFCLIISAAYLGCLGSFMTYPNERGQISTPEELYHRNLKLIGVPQSKRILERSFSQREILRKLSQRYVSYSGTYDDLMLDIHQDRNTSTFATSRFLQFYINNNPTLKNNPDSIYIFPTCTVSSFSSPFLFQKGSSFIDPINKILHRIIEAGITQKWFESSTPRKLLSARDPIQRLDLSQVLGCFIVLVVLHALSIIVFVIELITHSRKD